LADPCATVEEKLITTGLFAVGLAAPGGGYGTAGKTVYRSLNAAGEVQYVGITNNIVRRAGEHLRLTGIRIEPIEGLSNLSLVDARAVEQAIIQIHRLGKEGGTLFNKIDAISSSRQDYKEVMETGIRILTKVGYGGP